MLTKRRHNILVLIAAVLLLAPAVGSAQTGVSSSTDSLLREYILPVAAYEDTGAPITVDGRECTSYQSGPGAAVASCTCTPETGACFAVSPNTFYPVQESSGSSVFKIRVPESGRYKIEVTTANPNGASFYYASDEQVQSIINDWHIDTSTLPQAFSNIWTPSEQQQAIRNYITRVYVDDGNAATAPQSIGFLFTPNREPGADQTGFIVANLKAGEQELVLNFFNDLNLTARNADAPSTCLPGSYNRIANETDATKTPDCELDRNVVYRSIRVAKAKETTDVIGVRVYTNKQSVAPRTWYQRNVVSANPNIQSTTVDGYEAVRDGNTVYVNAANVPDSTEGGGFYTNIYVIAYNTNAAPTTGQVFNLMLDNWDFNTNLIRSNPLTYELEKDKLRRDTRRLADINYLTSLISGYKDRTGKYPVLPSGTFVPNHTFNNWPSWQANLGAQLGASLPTDPLSKMISGNQPITAYDCRKNPDGTLVVPTNAGNCDVVCSRDAAGAPQTGCAKDQQCLGDYCSICPVGTDPNTCWNAETKQFALPQTFAGCSQDVYDGAFTLGAGQCISGKDTSGNPYIYDGAYVYQYTALNSGASYLLNYRLEYQTRSGCSAEQCYFDNGDGNKANDCYNPGSCLANCMDTNGDGIFQSSECANPQFKNSTCYLGQWRSSCGDGFVQSACGEVCDSTATNPNENICDSKITQEDWYNEAKFSDVQCTPQCTLPTGVVLPSAYNPDPKAPSCGGYCGDQIAQYQYGEECDLGSQSGPIKRPDQGGSGGVGQNAQYACTGSGARTATNLIQDSGFEDATSVVVGVAGHDGQAGGWDGSLLNSGTVTDVYGAQPSDKWLFSSDIRGTDLTGYSDNNINEKRWISYQALLGLSPEQRDSYYTQSGNAGVAVGTGPRVIESVSGIAHSGERSVRLLDVGPKEAAVWTRASGVVSGTQYELKAYLRQDSGHYWQADLGKKEVYVEFSYLDQDGYAIDLDAQADGVQAVVSARGADGRPGFTLNEISANDWKEVAVKSTAPTGAAFVQLVVRTGYTTRGTAVLVDDVSFSTLSGCQTTGGWCGDGIVESDYGEQCDVQGYTAPSPQLTVNIVRNPGFEGNFAPWTINSEPKVTVSASESFEGRGSAQIDAQAVAGTAVPVTIGQEDVKLFSGKQYTVSLNVKTETGAVQSVALVYSSARSGSQTVTLAPSNTTNAGWTNYSSAVTPEFTSEHVDFAVSYAAPSARFYIDAISILPSRSTTALIPQYQCGAVSGKICQFKGGFCGDGKIDTAFGEICDDAIGTSCTADAQCGTTGSCVSGTCVSTKCDPLCRGSFCGDGIVSAPNSQGINESCDPLGDPTCYYNCQYRTLGGQCDGDFTNTAAAQKCAPNLSCAIRNFGDSETICLGTRGSYGCRSNNDCVLGYYCDARTTKCEPEIATYLKYHPESKDQLATLPAPSSSSFNVHNSLCPNLRMITSGTATYALDQCTSIFWNGIDAITKPSWTYAAANQEACVGVSRLPSIDELYSLVTQTPASGTTTFSDKLGLKLCCTSCSYNEQDADLCEDKAADDNYLYWSSTCTQKAADGSCTHALALNFKYGSIEEHAVTDTMKTRCLKQTSCGNGLLEEGEQCEFYTGFTPAVPAANCTADAQCGTGQVCQSGVCGVQKLFEQPVTRQCSQFGYDAGSLHCDRATCQLRTDNCVLASKPNLTCAQVCAQKDPKLTCESVGLDIDPTQETVDLVTNTYLIARNGAFVYTGSGNSCVQGSIQSDRSSADCAYAFQKVGGTCTITDGTTQKSAPYPSEYSYCNCI